MYSILFILRYITSLHRGVFNYKVPVLAVMVVPVKGIIAVKDILPVNGLISKWDLKVISIDCVIPVKGIIPIKGLSGHAMKAYVDIWEGILMIGVCVSLHTVAYSGLNLEMSIILYWCQIGIRLWAE